jgi:hypothetical protein
LSLDDARAILPHATFHGPARHGDITASVVNEHPSTICLIDGLFLQTLSVWHKEILFAIDAGIDVLGASSLGALRAAECAAFGMVGVGKVYEMFASGELEDDDEVALSHGDASEGFRPHSEAMVNIRATLEHARAEGVIDGTQHDALVTHAKSLYFPERTWARILKVAGDSGLEGGAIQGLTSVVASGGVDVKRSDAIELLTRVRDGDYQVPPHGPFVSLTTSHMFQAFLERDRRIERDSGVTSAEAIVRHAALNRPDFEDVRGAALDRMTLTALAPMLGVEVDAAEIEAETIRFRSARGLTDDADLAQWIERNGLDRAAFERLMESCAIRRHLHAWFVTANYRRKAVQAISDELRMRGSFEEAADATIESEHELSALAPSHDDGYEELPPLRDLLRDHMTETGWSPGSDLVSWAAVTGIELEEIIEELHRLHAGRRAVDQVAQDLERLL